MRRWRVFCCLAAAGYVAVWAVAFLRVGPTDMDLLYWPAVREVIAGHPLHIYSPIGTSGGPDHGPIGLIPLTMAGYAMTWLGWMDNADVRRAAGSALIGLLCLLMAAEAIRAVESLRGEPLQRRSRLVAWFALLCFPALWEGGIYGHIELPISIWLLLVSLRSLDSGRTGRGGIMLGLALLARSTSGLFALPIGIVVLRQRGRGAALLLAGTTMATVAAGIAPFAIADPGGVRRSLIEQRAHLGLGNGTLLSLFQRTPIEGAARQGDIALMLAATFLVTALMLHLVPDMRIRGSHMFALLVAIAACYPLLAKSVWPYYPFEASVFGMVLWFGRWRRGQVWRFGIPVLIVVVVSIIEAYQAAASGSPAVIAAGVVSSGLLVLVIRESVGLTDVDAAGPAPIRIS